MAYNNLPAIASMDDFRGSSVSNDLSNKYRVIPSQLSQAMSPYISDFADFYTVEST